MGPLSWLVGARGYQGAVGEGGCGLIVEFQSYASDIRGASHVAHQEGFLSLRSHKHYAYVLRKSVRIALQSEVDIAESSAEAAYTYL
jgi:hypothetical protein